MYQRSGLVLELGDVENAVKEVRREAAIAAADMLAGELGLPRRFCVRLAKILLEKVSHADLN
ncbi:hypothetical protein PHISP_05972 [Aspergillus sp. HF37]|nr:hypothetical protein PHISP_05972 [Aspergillus sp. HF37]